MLWIYRTKKYFLSPHTYSVILSRHVQVTFMFLFFVVKSTDQLFVVSFFLEYFVFF